MIELDMPREIVTPAPDLFDGLGLIFSRGNYEDDATSAIRGVLTEFLRGSAAYTSFGYKIDANATNSPIWSTSYLMKDDGGYVYISLADAEIWQELKLLNPIINAAGKSSADWIGRALELYSHGDEEGALHEISFRTTELKGQGNTAAINESIASAPIERMPAIIMIGILRNAFSVRQSIPGWDNLLDRASLALSAQGRDPLIALRGLK